MRWCGKNIVEPGRPHVTQCRMRIACWIPKVTNTHSEYVIVITFLLQQWVHERASMLSYTYIARLVIAAKPFQKKQQNTSNFTTNDMRLLISFPTTSASLPVRMVPNFPFALRPEIFLTGLIVNIILFKAALPLPILNSVPLVILTWLPYEFSRWNEN